MSTGRLLGLEYDQLFEFLQGLNTLDSAAVQSSLDLEAKPDWMFLI